MYFLSINVALMITPASTGMVMSDFLLRHFVFAFIAETVQNGSSAVYRKMMMGEYVGQKLLADSTFQMHQLSAGLTFQVKMATAISTSHVLIHVGGLSITPILANRSLGTKLG